MLGLNQKEKEKKVGKPDQILAYRMKFDEKHFSLAVVNIKKMNVKLQTICFFLFLC